MKSRKVDKQQALKPAMSAALYQRGRNRYAARSHILVVPTTFCTAETVRMIVEPFAKRGFGEHKENRVLALQHEVGCCSVGLDEQLAHRVLSSALLNPNVGHTLSVSLGCGSYCSPADEFGNSTRQGKLIVSIQGPGRREEVVVQAPGGRAAAVGRGREIVERLIREIETTRRVEAPLPSLLVGVLNGSSDPTSGLFSNPAVGHVCDALLDAGGRVAFSQTTETLGAEELLVKRADSLRTRNRLVQLLTATTMLRRAVESEGVECEPTQGNIRSGLSTLAEKSIGTIFKIGAAAHHRIVEIVPHGKRVQGTKPGIYFVDGPGQDVLCMSGLAAAGAGLLLFTTGRGAPTGSPFAPTIKITANRSTYEDMPDVIDVYLPVEEMFEQGCSLREIALTRLLPFMRDVASGKVLTKAELHGQDDFQVRQLWPID
jgi:altronate dehydratase large subunit